MHDLLAPIAGPLLATRRALAQITAAPNLEANKPETAEEIARVGAQLRGLVAELKERRAVRKPWIGYGEAI